MKKQDLIICFSLFFTAIFTRLPLVERYMSHTDASSLTLAVTNYNLSAQTPAPPGYPFYLFLAKVFNAILNDPYQSIIFVSVLFSGIGAIGFYLLGKSLGGRKVGVISSVLFLSSPAYYFFGLTIYPYIMVITLFIYLLWCVYEIFINKKKYGIYLAIIYVLVLFTRPQEIITSLPIFLLGFYGLNHKEKIKSVCIFLIGMLFWGLPFLYFQGGIESYLKISSQAASDAISLPSLTLFITKKYELLSGLFLSLGGGIFILILGSIKIAYDLFNGNKIVVDKKRSIFFLTWIIPYLAFNLFIRTEHVGYQSGYLIFFIFLVAVFIVKIFKTAPVQFFVVCLIIALNLTIFFYDRDSGHQRVYRQSSFHFSDLRRNEDELSEKISYINKNFSPSETVLIAGPYFWRHARYYLPEYQIYKIDGMFIDSDSANSHIISAKNLEFNYLPVKNKKFNLPIGTKNIILFDDDFNSWYMGDKKIVAFKGIAKLIVIPIKEKNKVEFSLGKVKLLSR